jgi:hypothetical protein
MHTEEKNTKYFLQYSKKLDQERKEYQVIQEKKMSMITQKVSEKSVAKGEKYQLLNCEGVGQILKEPLYLKTWKPWMMLTGSSGLRGTNSQQKGVKEKMRGEGLDNAFGHRLYEI